MFNSAYHKKRVLVTGHTGFKGGWLCKWLNELGADVSGIALTPDSTPNLFTFASIDQHVKHYIRDIRDGEAILNIVSDIRPDIVFHLAAQPLVRLSYQNPKATWDTNVGGTINILEAIRACNSVRACVVITSDKCYENREWVWGYRESDAMGGHDPYSASKGAAELVVSSYRRSFFSNGSCFLASARAGNVIGGGDWAADRIVVDFVKAIASHQPLVLRNPNATRPWQHVLEPLSGYLWLGSNLLGSNPVRFADAWNFGPQDDNVITVEALARRLVAAWGQGEVVCETNSKQPHEANLLRLDCSKARSYLGWHGVWNVSETIKRVVEWYKPVMADNTRACSLMESQILDYVALAKTAGLPWVF